MARDRDELSGLWMAFLRARLAGTRAGDAPRPAKASEASADSASERLAPMPAANDEASPANDPES